MKQQFTEQTQSVGGSSSIDVENLVVDQSISKRESIREETLQHPSVIPEVAEELSKNETEDCYNQIGIGYNIDKQLIKSSLKN